MTLLSLMEGLILNCEVWDTLRGESYDLSVVQRQDDLDRQVAAGELALGFSLAFKEGRS